MTDWNAVLGKTPQQYCDGIYHTRPDWIQGHISHLDARFLFERALRSGASTLIEVGTASGLSTAVLAHAAQQAARAGGAGDDFFVVTYDIDPRFYADRSRHSGDAAREMLDDELLGHVKFRSPATAIEVAEEHGTDTLDFVFIDAAHKHPWPTLDLLTLLGPLRAGAEVVLHDVNLPEMSTDHADWGAKHLFDEVDTEKVLDENGERVPNIGSIRIPADKAAFREELVAILHGHDWETEIEPRVVDAALA